MTDPTEAARLEHEHPGRPVSQAEQNRWFKEPRANLFDPEHKPTGLARRLLKASNAMTFADGRGHRDGWFDPVGHTKHAGYVFIREPKS